MKYFFIPKDYDSEVFENVIKCYTYPQVYEKGRTNNNLFFYVAVDSDEIIGMAVIEIVGRIAKLHSVAVAEDRRREKIATALVNGVCKELKETDIYWVETLIVDEGEQQAIEEALVQSLYFELLSEDECVSAIQLKDCVENSIISHFMDNNDKAFSYEELDEAEIRLFDKKLRYEGIYSGLTDEEINRQYSYFYKLGGEIEGCLLISDDNGELNIEYAYVDSDCEDKMVLLKMLGAATNKASQNMALDTLIHIPCINGVSSGLLKKLFPDCREIIQVKKYIKALM